MVLINLHRNLHEKSSFLSEIMFIRINPYLCHLLTRYQSTIFPNHKSCVRKKGVPYRSHLLFIDSLIICIFEFHNMRQYWKSVIMMLVYSVLLSVTNY